MNFTENYSTLINSIFSENNITSTQSTREIFIIISMITASFLFFIIILLIALLWRKYKNNKDQNTIKYNQLNNSITRYISDEFRTPLTLILSPITEILSANLNSEELKEKHQIIYHNTYRLLTLIDNLLDSNELSNQKLKVFKSDIIAFMNNLSVFFKPIAKYKNINYQVYSLIDELVVYFDPLKLEKIINNLLSNAFKYTEENGEIGVFITKTEKQRNYNTSKKQFNFFKKKVNYLSISVKDNGIGIPKDLLKHLNDSYEEISISQISEKGVGLGLFIIRKLVEEHHGYFEIESTLKKGTTITIFLPTCDNCYTIDEKSSCEFNLKLFHFERSRFISKEIIHSPKKLNTKNYNDKKGKILIVEDDSDLRNYIQDSLSDNYIILAASLGAQGYKMANEFKPDLIISDAIMAEVSGMELCEKIKRNPEINNIPIILLADKPLNTNIEKKYLPDSFIPKPFQLDKLMELIDFYISKKTTNNAGKTISIKEISKLDLNKNDKIFLSNIEKIVNDNISNQNFSVNELSEQIYLSRSQLFRRLKTLTGQNPADFIVQQRLIKAAELLKNEKITVSDAAFNVGFRSTEAFSKRFKKHFGVSPSKYN